MAEQRNNNNRWNWEVSGFEPRKLPSSSTSAAVAASSFDHHHDNYKPGAPLVRRYSISAASALAQSELANSNSNNQAVASKLQKLKDKVKLAREDYLELRQEASELHEYSNAKLERATRYLGVLANKTRKLDQFALETEARISPLINEKRRLFNDLLTAKGTHLLVYGPHVGQAELFHDDQPLVQSALGGYNVSIFAYGQTNSGKTHTMIRDLLSESGDALPKTRMGSPESFVELVQEKVDNPLDFSKVLKAAFQSRGNKPSKFNVSHLIIRIHIYYNNLITGENTYSKLSLVDLAGSEGLIVEELSSWEMSCIPYEMLTKVLADSLGGSSKTLMIVNVVPNSLNLSETLSSLNFSSRARNAVLSLGNRDTIKKWRDIANDARKELYEKEKESQDLKQEILGLKNILKDANDQCVLLFNEVQKAWKVSYMLQLDLKSENIMLADKQKIEKEQNAQLRNQVAQLLQLEQDQKVQIEQRDSTIQASQAKIKSIKSKLSEALHSSEDQSPLVLDPGSAILSNSKAMGDGMDSPVTTNLEEELKKRDALIELSSPLSKGRLNVQSRDLVRNDSRGRSMDIVSSSIALAADETEGTVALVKSSVEKVKTTPAGEYLTSALNDFDPEQHDSLAAISDGANKLLMLVLAAVIKAGASREHEILAEIGDAVFSFIRKMEPQRAMDTMLVSRVRILYIRSLLARSPELQSIKVSPVESFLEKVSTGRSRSSSRGNSPGRSPVLYVDEHIQGFKVNLKREKKSKFSSVVSKIRGLDQETPRQQVTAGKLKEINEEAKSFAIANKALAALFVHTPAGEHERQLRSWLAENFDFLSSTGEDASGGTTSQLELLSTAIMDGWMAELGAAVPPHTDALGQLLSEYSKRVYSSQLQHLKDTAGTLASEGAEDAAQVAKLRSALESVDHKRRRPIPEEDDLLQEQLNARKPSTDFGGFNTETDVAQWNVLQFNTGSTTPFIIKCGANSNSELVVKTDAKIQEPKGGEVVKVIPRPSVLESMSLEEMKHVFSQLPEALSLLALARTADGTRARHAH
ncbi:hypothetical protein DVH24_021255 [Malus domestica]|uniref:Kinesin motor domain-containing protein n=1 Tax=Malus domestica TaxID=3750 RepID=A0A498HWW9_MALDO|nr:hypothetical protein DVH24_021255 [Malus domestica]